MVERLDSTSSASRRPRLSVVCTGRNDDRAPDQFERLISVQRTLTYALRNVPFEFIFVEWNPDPDRPYLGDALFLEEARHFVVSREAHRRLLADAQLATRDGRSVKSDRAFLLNHANNVGLKHSRGEWVLITNLDDLFPSELGDLFERGESGALAWGVHPRWSYRLLTRYRRAQRSEVWRSCTLLLRSPRTAARGFVRAGLRTLRPLRPLLSPLRPYVRATATTLRVMAQRLKRTLSHAFGPRRDALHHSVAQIGWWARRQAGLVKRLLRAIVVRLLGGPADRPKTRRRPWGFLPAPLLRFIRRTLEIAGGAAFILVMRAQNPTVLRSELGRLVRSLHRRLRRGLAPTRRRARQMAKRVYDVFFTARVNWHVGRVTLTPGTLYRVRRQHVSGSLAGLGASDIPIDQFLDHVKSRAVPGPWNNHFPWTWACGDFLLMDRASWERIGGFPQQIGQLHADSVTIFRIVSEGGPVVLLDWNIYHIDHEDRFDAVPYVEYDFENVRQYFLPGWTKAVATQVLRGPREMRQPVPSPRRKRILA